MTKVIKLKKNKNKSLNTTNESTSVSEMAPKPAMTTAEIMEAILNLKNEELAQVDEDKIMEMRKNLNPYGRTIEGSDNFLNFSITQISHEWHKKFIITSMIGYLFRQCDEWKVPNGVPVVGVYDYLDNPEKLDTPELIIKKNDKSQIYDYEFNKEFMKKRVIVKEFLEEMFQFNPDEHVRSSYRPNQGDTSRTPLETMAARIAVKHLNVTDPQFKAKEELLHDINKTTEMKKVTRVYTNKKTGKTTKQVIMVPIEKPVKKMEPSNPLPLDETMKDTNVRDTVTNIIPPHDMFAKFKRYYTENYEELREATTDLYCEKPDLELAINPYSWHATAEEAETFKKQHAEEVISEVFTVCSGKWNFFDSWQSQRENVNFYNKNTIVLEEIINQMKRDEMIGQDLMKKRVVKEKKKNIIEAGPDAENFKKWKSENNNLKQMGAEYIGDMASDETPENAVEVPIWRIAEGGTKLTKDKMYSMAEAPSFVEDAKKDMKEFKTPGVVSSTTTTTTTGTTVP